jgi:hypothetical protein
MSHGKHADTGVRFPVVKQIRKSSHLTKANTLPAVSRVPLGIALDTALGFFHFIQKLHPQSDVAFHNKLLQQANRPSPWSGKRRAS